MGTITGLWAVLSRNTVEKVVRKTLGLGILSDPRGHDSEVRIVFRWRRSLPGVQY